MAIIANFASEHTPPYPVNNTIGGAPPLPENAQSHLNDLLNNLPLVFTAPNPSLNTAGLPYPSSNASSGMPQPDAQA